MDSNKPLSDWGVRWRLGFSDEVEGVGVDVGGSFSLLFEQ